MGPDVVVKVRLMVKSSPLSSACYTDTHHQSQLGLALRYCHSVQTGAKTTFISPFRWITCTNCPQVQFKITTSVCVMLPCKNKYKFKFLTAKLWLICAFFLLCQQDRSRLKEDRRQSPDRWPSTQCGCVLSSHLLLPPAWCGSASSSISTAVYFECTDETRVLIGPLEKPQDQSMCGPTSYLLPTMDECTFKTLERLNRKQNKKKKHSRKTHILQIPIQDETGGRHS